MIFWELFLTFSKIGIVNFGGGYAMLSLIHNEVVEKNAWLTPAEFTDIVAISQGTPGPIGINVATYTGYTSVINAGMPEWAAILGAVIASISILWLPFLLMVLISRIILKSVNSGTEGGNKPFEPVLSVIRPVVVGLIGAAAILLMNKDNFGSCSDTPFQFFISIMFFVFAFIGTMKYKISPIQIILLCGLAGILIF